MGLKNNETEFGLVKKSIWEVILSCVVLFKTKTVQHEIKNELNSLAIFGSFSIISPCPIKYGGNVVGLDLFRSF